MITRSFFLTSLLSLCIAAPLVAVGCAAPDDDADPAAPDAEEQVAETQDELTSAASQLVGSYWTHSAANGGFARVELKSNGKYTAQVDPAGAIVCITSPCLLPESGTWNATKKAGGGFRLRVRPTGKSSRWYDATKTGGGAPTLKLSRAGVTQTLNKLGSNQCLDSADCKTTEECGPKLCLMWCAVDDPFCCGPSTCQPKAPPPPPPPPPPACWGAWLDENGLCRTPSDGVYPASCCAGLSTPCGPNTCGAGKVCCNPLSGICTNPGDVCAQ
jgi:hypothetical protein